MNKRGITQTQFNWIFIMIAGALILIFFISVVYKQKSVSEEKMDITIQKNLQAILTGAEISKQTEQVITAPDKEFRYSCEGFSIGSLAAFNPRIVFAPDLLKSSNRELILYSLEWRVPFRIANFLYVTSPEVRYIIVNKSDVSDDNLINELNDLLPENINKEIVEEDKLNEIPDENNYKIKFIFLNKGNINNLNLDTIQNTKNEDISIVNIKGYKLDESGEIEFYKYKTFDKKLSYLKKESLIGAIFSENAEIYECNMKKAIERLKKVYNVYEERYKKLDEGYKEGDTCKSLYNYQNYLSPDFTKYDEIYENIKKLENENQKLQLYSCALIY